MKQKPTRTNKLTPISFPTAHEIEFLAGEAGLTIPDLCKLAGIAPSTFYRWRNGPAKMTPDTMQRLSDALNSASAA